MFDLTTPCCDASFVAYARDIHCDECGEMCRSRGAGTSIRLAPQCPICAQSSVTRDSTSIYCCRCSTMWTSRGKMTYLGYSARVKEGFCV